MIAQRDAPEEPLAWGFVAIPEHIGHNLTSSSTQSHPQPALIRFRTDDAVEFVKFKNILGLCGHQCINELRRAGNAWPIRCTKSRTVWIDTPKTRAIPRRLMRSRRAFSIKFHKAVEFAFASRSKHAGFAAIVTETALLAVCSMAGRYWCCGRQGTSVRCWW